MRPQQLLAIISVVVIDRRLTKTGEKQAWRRRALWYNQGSLAGLHLPPRLPFPCASVSSLHGLCRSVEAIAAGCSKVTSVWLYGPKGKENFPFSPPASLVITANIYGVLVRTRHCFKSSQFSLTQSHGNLESTTEIGWMLIRSISFSWTHKRTTFPRPHASGCGHVTSSCQRNVSRRDRWPKAVTSEHFSFFL